MCPQIGPLQYAREPAGRQDGVRHTIGMETYYCRRRCAPSMCPHIDSRRDSRSRCTLDGVGHTIGMVLFETSSRVYS